MRLERLVVAGFRNLAPAELDVDAPFVVWHGSNGEGKTNALEAVHWLCTLKPLRVARPRELVQWGGEAASVRGRMRLDGVTRWHEVSLGPTARKVSVDERPAELAEHFAGVRCIAFQPADAEIVTGEPARRRAWIDRAAFTAAPAHLAAVRDLQRVLAHKAALLRARDADLDQLDVLDAQLAAVGAVVAARRADILDALTPHADEIHRTIAGGTGRLSLAHRTPAALPDRRQALLDRIAAVRGEERRRRQVLAGPQSDDVVLLLDGQPARAYASRGQARSIVLALKLAELVAARGRGTVPLFLLDDASSELDRARTARVVDALGALGAQVFATTTAPDHLGALPSADTRRFTVAAGRCSPDPVA